MKVGVTVPMTASDVADGEPFPDWPTIRDFALRAEALGLDSVWVFDHLLVRRGNQPTAGIHESWTVLSALAVVTSRVELGTLVMATPFRNPGLLAKMAVAVDEVSGGRLIDGESVTFEGRWLQVRDVVLLPAPRRRIPILVASKGPRMLRLTAEHADAWNLAWHAHPRE